MENLEIMNREEAVLLDQQIKVYANMAWQNLVESCKCLKRMRDSKGYKQLGYSTFGEYTKASLNIEERQAYTYISTIERQGEAFLQSNASLGITKLALLNGISNLEREEFAENHDLAGMSVKEIKKLVEENNHKAEQISLLTNELEDAKRANENDVLDAEAEIDRLKKELEAERNKKPETIVAEPSEEMINKIRTDAKKEASAEADKKHKAETKALKEKLNAEKEKAVAAEGEKVKKELEEYKAKVETANSELAAAVKKSAELEKQMAVSASPETTKFTFYFEALQVDVNKIIDSLKKLRRENPETADKFKAAIEKYLNIAENNIKEV